MKKVFIVIFLILCSYVYGNEYEILEENGVLFFKYSKDELLNEVKGVLEENEQILRKDFKIDNGEKKYIEEIRFGKNYTDKTRYHVCKLENQVERCIFYMDEKRVYYEEKNILNKKMLKDLYYEKSGKKVRSLFIEEGPLMWFENNKLKEYRKIVKNEEGVIIGSITYIFNKKENLEKIEVSTPIGIKSILYGEEVKEYTSSIGNENYYFDPEGKFIEKKMYYKYRPRNKK